MSQSILAWPQRSHCDGCPCSSQFLNVLLGGDVCDRWGEYKLDNVSKSSWSEKVGTIRTVWRRAGIILQNAQGKRTNEYYSVDSQGRCTAVTRNQAMQIAMQNVGKHLNPSDWRW